MRGGKRENAGRPKGGVDRVRQEFIDLITNDDVKKALSVLRNKMKDGDSDAAKYILDQKFGKAKQRTDLSYILKDFTDERMPLR